MTSDTYSSHNDPIDPTNVVENNYETFHTLAKSDLPVAEDAERALELVDEREQ